MIFLYGLTFALRFCVHFMNIFGIGGTRERVRQVLFEKLKQCRHGIRAIPFLCDGSANDGRANVLITLQTLPELTKVLSNRGWNVFTLTRQAKSREKRNDVLQRIFFEIAIPSAPLELGRIQIIVINALDTSLTFGIRNRRKSIVSNLGQDILVRNLKSFARPFRILQIVGPLGPFRQTSAFEFRIFFESLNKNILEMHVMMLEMARFQANMQSDESL